MLVTSIFLFSHNVFNPIKTKIIIIAPFILSSAYAFNMDQSRILLFCKGLNILQEFVSQIHHKVAEIILAYQMSRLRVLVWREVIQTPPSMAIAVCEGGGGSVRLRGKVKDL